ncbi:MAG: lipopolysaccharide biosynthesis protein, partial [Mediterranea sp.]|nr:lipopolysaccharide biosynthesis protein [Mediterranea sp.]
MENSANSKRIAKNTLLLYIRTFFTMAIGLYASRVILNVLGVDDYGIYNVVGGVVAMFSVISGALSSSISRFITFELGRGNIERLKIIFSTSVNIQMFFALIILIIGSILGGWFLNHKMNIPHERMLAANWVLYCSLITFCVNLISLPYNACIIAHERMKAFAYISILEAVLKLAILCLLLVSPFDKLSTYTVLLTLVALLVRIIYGIYCKRSFEECDYKFVYDKAVVKAMSAFASWNLFGNGAYLLNTQGVNILINLYFGVTTNAARGIAAQVETAVSSFVGNFTTAMNPQITKSYATGNLKYMFQLVCYGAKY